MRFTFRQTNFIYWQKAFAQHLGVRVHNKKVQIPDELGTGWVYADQIDQGISFVAMDLTLHDELTFHRKPNHQNGLIIFFNQVKIARSFEIKTGDAIMIDYKKERNNIYISASTNDVLFTYSPESKLQRLGFYLSPQWLQLKKKQFQELIIYDVMDQDLTKVDLVQLNQDIKTAMQEIFEADLSNKKARIIIKTKALMLLDYLFQTYFFEKENTPRAIRRKGEDLENLRKVANILSQEQSAPYPSIANLSRIALMSSTRLKQRFKEVYGFGIFEFYNKLRLEKASEMLKQGIHVKQVARDVGYENASNFTKAFKKEFNTTPGKIWEAYQSQQDLY